MRALSSMFALLLPALASCALAMRAGPEQVRIAVHNPGGDPVMVRACGPLGCSDFQQLAADARATFTLDGGGGTRAVVEGKRGDRFVARHPVDFTAGGAYRIELVENLTHR